MNPLPPVNCTPMVALSTSTILKVSLIGNTLVALSALPVLFWASYKLWSMRYAKLFHVNFKILIQIHLLGFIIHCVGRIALHSTDLYNYTVHDDPCDMIPNIYRCFILRFMYNAGLWLTNATAVSLIIERWIATKRSVTYEEDSVVIGGFLAVMQFTVTAIPLALLYWQVQFEGVTMYYCVAAKATMPYFPQLSASLSICFQITARISFHYLHRVNKVRVADAYDENPQTIQQLRTFNVHSTLSNRYQLEQNISSITCLKTFANMSSIYVVFQNACFITLMQFAKDLETFQYSAITEVNGSYPIYSIITVIIMSRSMEKVRNSIDKNLVHHLQTPKQSYFDNFKKQIGSP